MSKVVEFKGKNKGDADVQITKQFCSTCGGSLDLWVGTDGVAYGLCNYCDFGVGKQPIALLQDGD